MKKIIIPLLCVSIFFSGCNNTKQENTTKNANNAVSQRKRYTSDPYFDIIEKSKTKPISQTNKIFKLSEAEIPPTYPGGMKKFDDFISQNIKYLPIALKNKTQGNSLISFIIEKDGSLSNMKVERKLGNGTDKEALRILRLSKKWNPGLQGGRLIRVKYYVPIKFSLK